MGVRPTQKAGLRAGFYFLPALTNAEGKKNPLNHSGFYRNWLNYFSLISLYSTCLRAFGSNFMIDIFSGIVFLFLLVV